MTNMHLAFSLQATEDRKCTINSEPCAMETWGFEDPEYEADIDDSELPKKHLWGAVVGCSDGSLYLFRPDLSKSAKRKPPVSKRRFSASSDLPYRRAPHLSFSRSRNASPSASKTNLTVYKSRAVSGLSKERVEAPKNFVDFEDEQEKMKGMIAERGVRDMKDSSPRSSLSPPFDLSVHRMDDAITLASVESSSPLISPPLSPTLSPQSSVSHRKHLFMRARILPQDFGYGHSIVTIRILEEGELFLALQESGKVLLFKTLDGDCVASATPGTAPAPSRVPVVSHGSGSQVMWEWKSLQVAEKDGSILVIAVANADTRTVGLGSGETDDKARVVMFELSGARENEYNEIALTKIGDLVFSGRAEGVALCQDANKIIKLYQVDITSRLLVRTLAILPLSATSLGQRQLPISTSGIPLPQPLRGLVSRSGQPSPSNETSDVPPRVDTQLELALGILSLTGKVEGLRLKSIGATTMGAAWSANELLVFSLRQSRMMMRCVIPVQPGVKFVDWLNENIVRLTCSTKIETYVLPDAKNNESHDSIEGIPTQTTTKLLSSLHISRKEVVCSGNDFSWQLLSIQTGSDGQRIVVLQQGSGKRSPRENSTTPVWSTTTSMLARDPSPPRITAILPLELALIVVGYNDGCLRKFSIEELLSSRIYDAPPVIKTADCAIVSLFAVRNARTGRRLVVGGGDDGSINFWDLSTLDFRARWVIFTEPLTQAIQLESEAAGRLQGCCLCVSGDGTIAVIVIDSFDFLYLIPGSPAPLRTLWLGSDNLMLFYADGRTRLWDVKTREFWRSMSSEKAAEMLAQGGWFSAMIGDGGAETHKGVLSALNKSTASGDPPPILLFDIPALLDKLTRGHLSPGIEKVNPERLKALLVAVHTQGLDELIDRVVSDACAGATNSVTNVGSFDAYLNHQSFCFDSSHGVWQVSPDHSAGRLLTIVSLLRALMSAGGYEELVGSLLLFYTTSLPMAVGKTYQAPNLMFLARHWNESPVADIRLAAKHLFESEIARLPDDEIIAIAEKWQHKLPCLLPDSEKQSAKAALALILCGNISIEKYSLLSSTTLADVAKSITIFLYDDTSPHRALAIELCSRGFEIWQQYFDAMEALRSLFTLATSVRKEAISVRNAGQQARMAVLQIASNNSPLFMTTLSLDILHPRSIEYSKSVMQIIAFLIRKKPLVLYPNLPRLMEAVVKSLDPGSNDDREAVMDAVTEIIALVVQTFPTVDFHTGSQRLAVGTSEGAVIMYDLKTATRLYVLEGHRKRLTGISFSPDGRRMVTLSVEECVVLVWKVGSSFTSFFHPGAPPRQGRSGSDPYKTLSFRLQNEAMLTIEATLKQVRFEWQAERSVRVEIRETMFTFST
ncbi:WD40 repeat-like protein [Phellopilus nigrolimitatus]|nr:WD40 repeat-like protein [Phellopilus nigrolimitatus]